MTQVIFSPLSWGEGMAMRRNTLLPHCETAGRGGKSIIIHFSCMRQERKNNQETNVSSALCAECPMFNLAKYTYTKKAQPLFCRSLSLISKSEGQTSGYFWLHNEALKHAALCGPVGSILLFTESLLTCRLVVEHYRRPAGRHACLQSFVHSGHLPGRPYLLQPLHKFCARLKNSVTLPLLKYIYIYICFESSKDSSSNFLLAFQSSCIVSLYIQLIF